MKKGISSRRFQRSPFFALLFMAGTGHMEKFPSFIDRKQSALTALLCDVAVLSFIHSQLSHDLG